LGLPGWNFERECWNDVEEFMLQISVGFSAACWKIYIIEVVGVLRNCLKFVKNLWKSKKFSNPKNSHNEAPNP
jgi:hypothetical protein